MQRAHKIQLKDPTPQQKEELLHACQVSDSVYDWALGVWEREYQAAVHSWRLENPYRFCRVGKPPKSALKERGYKRSTAAQMRAEWTRRNREGRLHYRLAYSTQLVTKAIEAADGAFKKWWAAQSRSDYRWGRPQYKQSDGPLSAYLHNQEMKILYRGQIDRKTGAAGPAIHLPKGVGWIKLTEELRWPGAEVYKEFSKRPDRTFVKVEGGTISKSHGRWYVSIQCDVPDTHLPMKAADKVAGVDFGLQDLFVLGDGTVTKNPKFKRSQLDKLAEAQRTYSFGPRKVRKRKLKNQPRAPQKTKKSRRWLLAKKRVSKLESRFTEQRRDHLHKATTELVEKHTALCIEDLSVVGMRKGMKSVRKGSSDAPLGEARRQLEYKGLSNGTKIHVAERSFPSTRKCSNCNHKGPKKGLSARGFKCKKCGFHLSAPHGRDVNAARNLKQRFYPGAVTIRASIDPL